MSLPSCALLGSKLAIPGKIILGCAPSIATDPICATATVRDLQPWAAIRHRDPIAFIRELDPDAAIVPCLPPV